MHHRPHFTPINFAFTVLRIPVKRTYLSGVRVGFRLVHKPLLIPGSCFLPQQGAHQHAGKRQNVFVGCTKQNVFITIFNVSFESVLISQIVFK